jgi:putative metallohydrolase (TIGR04338 family)
VAAAADARERQRRLYAAEEVALTGVGRDFGHLGEVRAYVEELLATDWWADRWPQVDQIAIDRTRSGRFAGYAVDGSAEIRLSELREPVLLHEIAHVVTPGAGHGAAFVTAFLALVRERLGFHSYGALLAELRRRDLAAEGDRG